MIKRLFIVLAMVVAAVGLHAQWSAGLMVGYDYNSYDYAKGYGYDLRYGGRSGFAMSVPVQYTVNDWFALRADVAYLQKGHKMHRTGYHAGPTENVRDHYLHLPIQAQFSFGTAKVRGYLGLGGYVGYWLHSHRQGVDIINMGPWGTVEDNSESHWYYYDECVDFNSDRDQRFDAGLVASLGVGYRITPRIEARAETVLHYSVIDTASGSSGNLAPRYNSTFSFQVGCIYYFTAK